MKKKSYNSPELCLKQFSLLSVLASSGLDDEYFSEEIYDDFW